MNRKKLVAGAATALALTLGAGTMVAAQQSTVPSQQEPAITSVASGTGENEAGEGKDSDKSLTGSPAQKAADAALRATGGGTLLEVEKGDDPGAAYEVEIRKAGGSVAEVMVDDKFSVIGQVAGD